MLPDADRGLQRPNGVRSRTTASISVCTEPGDSCGEIKSLFLARRRRTLDHSLAAGDAECRGSRAPARWPYRNARSSLISRIRPSSQVWCPGNSPPRPIVTIRSIPLILTIGQSFLASISGHRFNFLPSSWSPGWLHLLRLDTIPQVESERARWLPTGRRKLGRRWR